MTVFPYTVLIIAVIVDFTIFCLLIFVLAYLSSWSSAFTIYLSLFVGFFLPYRFFLLMTFSLPLREDPLTFFRVSLVLINSSFLLIWKILYLFFNYKWWSCWLEYSRLQVFPFEVWIYHATPSGLPSFCTKICWYHYGGALLYGSVFLLQPLEFFLFP